MADEESGRAGGLVAGGIHEFYGGGAEQGRGESLCGKRSGSRGRIVCRAGADWRPLCLVSHLAVRAAGAEQKIHHRGHREEISNSNDNDRKRKDIQNERMEGFIVWIGRRCWPSAQFLARRGVLERSIFVAALETPERLWAMELCMRCPAVAAAICDGEKFTMPATRRLELAAAKGQCLAVLVRPGREAAIASAATTRWAVHRRVSDNLHPAWTLGCCAAREGSLPRPDHGRWSGTVPRVLSLFLPEWSIDCLRRRMPKGRRDESRAGETPLLLTAHRHNRQVVVSCCAAARGAECARA